MRASLQKKKFENNVLLDAFVKHIQETEHEETEQGLLPRL